MKLKAFQSTNQRLGRPIIRFSKKTGTITITKSAALKMELSSDDKVKFFQDEDSPKDWYVSFEKENGLSIRTLKDSGGYIFNNSGLKNEFVKTLNIPEECNSFIVGSPTVLDGVKYYPLLLNKF